MKTLFIIAAIIVILRLVKPLMALNQLLRMRVWRTRWRLLPDEEVAPHVRNGLRAAVAELEALGFQLLGWMVNERDPPGSDPPRTCANLFHPVARAYATAGFSSVPDVVNSCVATFATFGADDRTVRTFGGGEQSVLGEPPHTVACAPYAPTLALQWEAHCQSVHAAGLVPTGLDHDAVFKLWRDRQRAQFESLVADGSLLLDKGSEYVLAWPLALRATRAVLSSMARTKAQRANRARLLSASLVPPAAVPIEEEVNAYHTLVARMTGRPRASFLAALFALTIPLFVVAGWYSMGAATTAVLVLGIVLFHELGHYLAMRALGYVDTTIFFVPFLGGIAAGRKDNATLAQQMLVLLAGPLPGLLIALALARAPLPAIHWLREAVPLLAVINLFNLLPVFPLDGGQIAYMLLFARRPWLDVASRAVSGVGLVLIGWAASGTFILILGVVTLVQLPGIRRQAEVRRLVREARIAWPNEPAERLFFRVLATSPLAGSTFAQKVTLGRTVLTQASLGAPVRAAALVGWLSAYGATFAVGCVALVLSFAGSARAGARPDARDRVEAVVPMTCSPPPVAATEDKATPAAVFFCGMAIFDAPESHDSALAQLKSAAPSAVSRSIGPALLVWTRYRRGEGDDNDTLRKKVGAALTAAGGRYFGGTLSSLAFECVAPDETSAQAIVDRLEDFVVAARGSTPIAPPWLEAEPTEAQRRARRTLRVAMSAVQATPYRLPLSWWLPFWHKGADRSFAEHRAEQLRAAEAALAAARAAGSVDEEVARIVIARLASQDEEEVGLDDGLQGRLGSAWPKASASAAFAMNASRTRSRVRIELGFPRPANLDSEVRPMVSWLCAQSCADPRVIMHTPEIRSSFGKD